VNELPHWRKRPQKILALAMIASLLPLPVLAGEGNPPTSTTSPLRAAVDREVERELVRSVNHESLAARSGTAVVTSASSSMDRHSVTRRSEQGTTPQERSGQFFKTGPGIAVLAVFAAGVGYALYSAQHDRVHSPGKQ
jgi:hypothetical protein